MLFALIKAIVVGADNYNTEIDCEVSDVDVQDECFRDARDADWCPGFTTVFHAGVGVDIVQQHLYILWLHRTYLLRICENAYWVQSTH